MRLSFMDAHGQTGVITKQLDVKYQGTWEQEVKEYVDQVEDKHRSEDNGLQTMNVFSELVIDLPQETPIIEIERMNNQSTV